MPDTPTTNNIQMRITQSAANGDITYPETTKVTDELSQNKLDELINHAKNIDVALGNLVRGNTIPSQTNARNYVDDRNFDRANRNSRYGNQNADMRWRRSTRGNGSRMSDFGNDLNHTRKDFIDSFEDAIIDGFIDSNFKNDIKKVFNDLARELNIDVRNLSGELGKRIGQNAVNAFKQTPAGQAASAKIDSYKQKGLDWLKNKGQSIINNPELGSRLGSAAGKLVGGDPSEAIAIAKTGLSAVGNAASKLASGAGQAATGMVKFAAANPEVLIAIVGVAAAMKALSVVTDQLKAGFQGVKDIIASMKKAANRDQTSREKNVKLANQRLQADVETLVKKPFEILQQAAEAWYQTWDSNLKTINATQGYTKSDLQDLMSNYSQRLRSEGLTAYVSGASITDNLAKVLASGLSGKAAEEFAYQATKLNAAVPTQDFFNYAGTYASIAANAIKEGATEQEALTKANRSLSSFTSGLLYASRTLSGGFTTGLQDAASIYQQAAQIAQTSETGDVSNIASVLLAVRGEVGAVAPDLASSITDTIYKMLTGGNSSDVVALRSLAGVNASNTEFLRAVSKNPQKVFSTLFNNLAKMYGASSDAYMEKAEGYAELFGMSSSAFARIDFSELSQAISNMNMSDASLNENMKLLLEGQTTTSAEQLRNQQINQYMFDEGLSLVLDNEAGRAIQQHMWDEQANRELMEATYAVDLTGESAEALVKIMNAVNNLLGLANPFMWGKKLGNLIITATESKAQQADIQKILELGKVGSGNATSMYQLTTRGQSLNIVDNLVNMMGGAASYNSNWARTYQALTNPMFLSSAVSNARNQLTASLLNRARISEGPGSTYSWGNIGKSSAAAIRNILGGGSHTEYSKITTPSGTSAASASAAAASSALSRMLADDYLVDKYVKEGKTYDEWAASASSFGIANLDQAMEAAGYDKANVQSYFQSKETEAGMVEEQTIREHEQQFRETGINFWETKFWEDFKNPLTEQLTAINDNITSFKDDYFKQWWQDNENGWNKGFVDGWIKNAKSGWSKFVSDSDDSLFNKFAAQWTDYIVKNVDYYKSFTSADVQKLDDNFKAKERGDTVNALAELLTTNLTDLTDPQLQTNALLAQILIKVTAIEAELNNPDGNIGTSSLLGSLSAMALGIYGNNTSSDTTSTKKTNTKKK